MPAACAHAACGSRAAFEGLGCAMVLNRKMGGLVTGTCGLGGPQYGEEQTAGNRREA